MSVVRRAVVVSGAVLVILFLAASGLVFPIDIAVALVAGWAWFIADALPRVRPGGEALAMGLVCAAGLVVVGHRFARWLHASWAGGRGAEEPPWRPAWTASAAALFGLAFVNAIAAAGIAHQAAWLLRGPFLVADGGQRRTRMDLMRIGTAIESYQVDHGFVPRLPDGTVADLLPLLEPGFGRDLPRVDAWDRPIFWRSWPGTDTYSIISLGRDGLPDGSGPAPVTAADRDLFFANGILSDDR